MVDELHGVQSLELHGERAVAWQQPGRLGDVGPVQRTSSVLAVRNNFYSELTALTDATHDYLSKPWGLGEFGDDSPAGESRKVLRVGGPELEQQPFPKLKLISLYDASAPAGISASPMTRRALPDPKELANLALLSKDPLIVAGRASVNGG